ncbi:hypothetical protein GCM10027564_03630 [Luteimonas notoginsengisoli]
MPPVAAAVDEALLRLDAEIDWLLALNPVDGDRLWAAFDASGRKSLPPLRYLDRPLDLAAARERLLALPVDRIESPLLSALLGEKQRELERQVELVRLRGTDGFIKASLDLFGEVPPALLGLAHEILETVGPGVALEADAGIDEVLEAAQREFDWYRQRCPGFVCEIVVSDDLNSLMMVSHGRFYIDAGIRVPRARIEPLLQHEIGTHIVTRHNGSRQALRQLEAGLAHYDPLQEGLGVLAEYLSGFLPGERLRMLAARVVAVDMAMHRHEAAAIFERLHEAHGLPTDDAFDVTVRALRGGGLSKDAVYLRGLRDLVHYLREGGDFAMLFVGKFALSHRVVLDQLIAEGWVTAPEVLPRYYARLAENDRLDECRTLSVVDLYHEEPEA